MIELDLPGAQVRFADRHDDPARLGGDRRLVGAKQVHGARVVRDDAGGEADGIATARTDLAPFVRTADCLPVAIAGPGAVAMVHAGWRGLAAGVLAEGVAAVRALDGDGELQAAIGPGAGPCCYEVSEEVAAALGTTRGPSGTVDLKAVAAAQLRAAGVATVHDVGRCTICDETFFSFRREGERAGRQLGVAWRRASSAA